MAKAKKASGRNISNDERNTVQLLLRAPEEGAERLRAIRDVWKRRDPKVTLWGVVEAGLDALEAAGAAEE
jgi:hypothetical protein